MDTSNDDAKPAVTALTGRRIAIPEAREQQILARLLRNRGAQVFEIPLVSILDAPDPVPVRRWLEAFIAAPPGLLILLTGEGLQRLLLLAETTGLRADFVRTLARVPVVSRGPKPERVLCELGLAAAYVAAAPTTEGVIATLSTLPLQGLHVGVQLYGDDPNHKLLEALQALGAEPLPVAPYVYADQEADEKVRALLRALAAGDIDVLALTAQPQFKRLQAVAQRYGQHTDLDAGLKRTVLAAVGPLVREQLQQAGYAVAIMPERVYFMKPLVLAIQRYFESLQRHGRSP
ncbi:MAG: uroporphyrinogen-III synthase [Pseudomonadales bacterium]|jgi:uroporphyrinogen-III synthase|nr:uroporphyrinogen-III synthase [Pseudomonadales bacterium]